MATEETPPPAAAKGIKQKDRARTPRGSPRGEPAQAKAEPPTTKSEKGESAKIDLEDHAEVNEGMAHMLKERKARFCVGCRAELSLDTLVCTLCSTTAAGERSTASEATTKRILERFCRAEVC